MWDRLYPAANSPAADLTTWTPKIVFINLGENDESFAREQNLPFPTAAYISGYVRMARAIRAAYPSAQLVILRGGMSGGSQSKRLRDAWDKVVTELETADPHLTHFVFQHWSSTHPRVDDHRAMADELIAWLRTQRFAPTP